MSVFDDSQSDAVWLTIFKRNCKIVHFGEVNINRYNVEVH